MGLLSALLERVRLRILLLNELESATLREYFSQRYDIVVGKYSYGCFDRWRIPQKTRIGRYCSFARSVRILDANHPMQALTTHPFVYERRFGLIPEDLIDPMPIVIEDDVWLSHNVTVTPGCKFIGRGAIIGAGSVVTRDVDRYAIVAGAPAKVLRSRFNPDVVAAIEASRWWMLDKQGLSELLIEHPNSVYAPDVDTLGLAFHRTGLGVEPARQDRLL